MARRESEERFDAFPWLVTLGCIALGSVIYLHSTRPALAERRALERAEARMIDDLRSARREALDTQRRKSTLGKNPEQLLVEIDAQNLTTREAAEAHAENPEGPASPR